MRAQARSTAMFWSTNLSYKFHNRLGPSSLVIALLLFSICPARFSGQSLERELNSLGKGLVTIRNRNGRVSVIASDDEKSKVRFTATSASVPIERADVTVSGGEIIVRERSPSERIDLVVHVPARARVKIETETGMVDVIGNVEVADVTTNTGTIHADVPLDALKFKFLWQSSRPRYLSDVELPRIKEGRAGTFSISGTLGPKVKKSKRKKVDEEGENASGKT